MDSVASKKNILIDLELIKWASEECFVPITIGGGIKSLDNIRNILKYGADKICINSIIREDPDFIQKSSDIFGSQCITVSIDVIKYDNQNRVYDYSSKNIIDMNPEQFAKKVEALGAGEILLNSVNRDGSGNGYDLDLLKSISDAVSIPVIAAGGVGCPKDLSDGIISGKVQAVAAGNIFQHTEHSTIAAKAQLLNSGIDVRLSSKVKYKNFLFDKLGRPY